MRKVSHKTGSFDRRKVQQTNCWRDNLVIQFKKANIKKMYIKTFELEDILCHDSGIWQPLLTNNRKGLVTDTK